METVIDGIALHLETLGLACIRASTPVTLYFPGRDWEGIFARFSTFTNFLGQGEATVALEGPRIAASYGVRPGGLAIGGTLLSLGFSVLLFGIQTSSHLTLRAVYLSLLDFLVFYLLFFALSVFSIHRGMKKELINAFETGGKIIESRTRNYDTSLVEAGHRHMGPSNLARSA